ncbi:DUF4430 domain-containing protein [Miniphocaeibacter halophilus]|uniref:DUF4430 domain-containing protein n=1 Tax=Miniphocaeibacter halophilus TaxID=2931922 RepID=A0AC61MS46_9FIRM|nr:DUF4430 domain-containing protein [Miniphocaeibacter halophilus]QQK07264.1 DUF4430 domain-containing protein [Miniphocaeibacter halophilus]
MKKIKFLVISLLLVFSLVACSTKTNTEKETNIPTENNTITVNIILEEDKQEFANEEIETTEDKNLLSLLKDNFEIVESDGFITSINGREQDENEGKYWTYTVNNEYATTGAGEYILKNKDTIVFSLEKFENE